MSSGLTHMSVEAFSDEEAFFAGEKSDWTYEVKINPETFDRTLTVRKLPDDSSEKGQPRNLDAGTEGESYSFDLYFDGTGVASSISSAADLKKDFNQFLDVVFRKQKSDASGDKADKGKADAGKTNDGNKDQKETPSVNFVRIKYCGDCFKAKLDSLSIKYLLFDKDGNPLRIKASCRFSSVEQSSKVDKKGDDQNGGEPDAPPLQKDTPNKNCVHPEKSYEKTVSSAKKNDSMSLMCCCYTPEEMTPRNYTPANYTPVEGYGE